MKAGATASTFLNEIPYDENWHLSITLVNKLYCLEHNAANENPLSTNTSILCNRKYIPCFQLNGTSLAYTYDNLLFHNYNNETEKSFAYPESIHKLHIANIRSSTHPHAEPNLNHTN